MINTPEKYLKIPKPDGLTISEITEAIGLNNEEKLVSRILKEILDNKYNKCIEKQPFRLGRIFLYKYYSTRPQPKICEKALKKSSTKFEELKQQKISETPVEASQPSTQIPIHKGEKAEGSRQLDLNDECYALICSKSENYNTSKTLFVREYFTKILKSKNKKRSITIDTINRYIYTLNLVYSKEVVSMIDLKNHIKTELERGFGWDIDNKTMKSITGLLKEKELLNTFEFDIQYLANEPSDESELSEEEIEYFSGNEEDPTFKLKKVDKKKRKIKERNKKETKRKVDPIKAQHSKIMLAKPGIHRNDERVYNDPSITNPSLRQDKELPSSIFKKIMDFK